MSTYNAHRVVYLIIERGGNGNKQTFWRVAGSAYVCRDGSLNVKLDIHPTLTFNIREPKTNGEYRDAIASMPQPPQIAGPPTDEDIPF